MLFKYFANGAFELDISKIEHIDRNTINHITNIICETKTHTIRVLSDATGAVVATLNQILFHLNGPNCNGAPIIVADRNDVYYQSYRGDRFGPSVFVVILSTFDIHPQQIVHKFTEGKKFIKYFTIITKKIKSEIEYQQTMECGLRKMFQQFWDRDILNVVIVFYYNEVKLYTYTPFTISGSIELLDMTQRRWTKDLFYNKLNNIDGYQLKVSMYSDEVRAIPYNRSDGEIGYWGVDGLIANVVRERYEKYFLYLIFGLLNTKR